MKALPNHRMRQYVKEKPSPLKASDAMSGSPSPCNVFASTPIQADVKER